MRIVDLFTKSLSRLVPCVVLAAFASAGCGEGLPTGPDTTFLNDPAAGALGKLSAGDLLDDHDWAIIASVDVDDQSAETLLAGGRYELAIPAGAATGPTEVTIMEWDSAVIDFKLGPAGATFNEPVTLTIDYSDTSLSHPQLWRFTKEGVVVPVQGTADPVARQFVAKVEKFARFVLEEGTGTAGWD